MPVKKGYKLTPERLANHRKAYNDPVLQRWQQLAQGKFVLQYTLDHVLIAEHPTAHEASRITGINRANICSCCRGEPKHAHAGGFIWRYRETHR